MAAWGVSYLTANGGGDESAPSTAEQVDSGVSLAPYTGEPLEDPCQVITRYLPVEDLLDAVRSSGVFQSFDGYSPYLSDVNEPTWCVLGSLADDGGGLGDAWNVAITIEGGEGAIGGDVAIPELGDGAWFNASDGGAGGPRWTERGWRFKVLIYGNDVAPRFKDFKLALARSIHTNVLAE